MKGGVSSLNEDTLGNQLKSGIAQFVALEITRGNGRDNRAISRYLPWLYHPPSTVQQGWVSDDKLFRNYFITRHLRYNRGEYQTINCSMIILSPAIYWTTGWVSDGWVFCLEVTLCSIISNNFKCYQNESNLKENCWYLCVYIVLILLCSILAAQRNLQIVLVTSVFCHGFWLVPWPIQVWQKELPLFPVSQSHWMPAPTLQNMCWLSWLDLTRDQRLIIYDFIIS